MNRHQHQLTPAEIRESREFLEIMRAAQPAQRPLRTQPAPRYQTRMNEAQPVASRSQQFIYESMQNGTFENWADRSQPMNLPPGVTMESVINDLASLWADGVWKRW